MGKNGKTMGKNRLHAECPCLGMLATPGSERSQAAVYPCSRAPKAPRPGLRTFLWGFLKGLGFVCFF